MMSTKINEGGQAAGGRKTIMNKDTNKSKGKTGRTTEGIEQKIPDNIVALAKNVKIRVARNLISFMHDRKVPLKNIDIYKELYPIIPDEATLSRILSGERPVTLAICVVLHYVFDIDLNQFIAGDNSGPPVISKEFEDGILAYADYIRQCRKGK